MQTEGINTREMSIVLPHHLVRLEVPALDELVLASGKEVGVAMAHSETAHRRNVPGERELKLARRHIPDLYDAIARPRGEPLVVGLDGDAADPAEVPRDNPHEFPRRMVRRLGLLCSELLFSNQCTAQHRARCVTRRVVLRHQRLLQLRCGRGMRERRPQRHGLRCARYGRRLRRFSFLFNLRKNFSRLGRLAFGG